MSKKTLEQIREDIAKTKITTQSINKELDSSFLEYAMSVIVARAIPDARDGLKPVHRRVLYAAYGLGLSSDKPHKKSARIVGEVIGKYHPHGDTAAYDTMVRMAQDFSMRYPLIDGHGNFGSTDDSAAAMRYTEARLSKVGDIILEDIEKNTVKFVDNYDGSEIEPEVLTAIMPNMLANGSSGIAVGMATNIPPHNLNELIAAIKMIAENPQTTVDDIKTVLKGPDFPTGAELIGIDGIDSYFRTGRGSVTVRSKVEIVERDGGRSAIVVSELPYMTSRVALAKRIEDLVKDKLIEGITGIDDFSNREGTRIEIYVKKDYIPEVILNQLFKQTQLQTTFAVNMLALVGGEPKVLGVIDALNIYLDHQIIVLTNKTQFELKKAKEREHILAGLHIATSNIDAIIELIKKASDNDAASRQLIEKYNLTEIQAKAIMEMKLRSLSGLERKKIEDELTQVHATIVDLTDILEKRERKVKIIEDQLDNLSKKFGDARRTVIRNDITGSIQDEDLIPKEDILVTMSSRGYLKRLPVDTYRVQKRGGVGVIGLETHTDDDVEKIIVAHTHTDLLLFSDLGKVYRVRGHNIPVGSRTSKGIPAINIIGIDKGEKVLTILPIDSYENSTLFFCTTHGITKKTDLKEFLNINKGGKKAITLKENDKLFNVVEVKENDEIYIGASNGNMVRFNENQVRNMGRTAAGVRGIQLTSSDTVVGLSTSALGNKILSIGARGAGKLSDVEEYRMTKRNAKGVKTLKVSPKTGKLVYIGAVSGNEDALMITTTGKVIRFRLSTVNTIGRSTSGVKLMNVDDSERIQSVTMFSNGSLGDAEEDAQEAVTKQINLDDL
ncbi:MAG: DNA topoisomerase (ATP-hydrolyzing) subunit A [Mycoplasmataceae bacterium]|jgi:DNA gyrase subunit A|nr:DNA topoisomerase (ATP-hydrolyzing) subunit A [Mycoplasmataceae bacterium]